MSLTTVTYFNPKQISGCSLWLDGADTSSSSMTFSSGNTLSVWKDKSNTGNNFNITTGPVTRTKDGNYPVVNIGANAVLTSVSQISLTTSSVFFIVCKLGGTTLYSADANVFAYVLAFPNILGGDLSIRFSPTGIGNANNTANNNDLVGIGGAFYVNGNYSPSSPLTTYVNSYNVIGGTSYTSGTTSLSLSTAFYNRYFYGNIAEFIYYTSITSTQRQQVEGYLTQKWGITASLPGGHPGLTQTLYGAQYNYTRFLSKQLYYNFFSPRQIPGCILWLDAADASSVTTSGTTVTAIRDKSVRATVLTSPAGFTYPNNIFNGSYPSFYNTSASGGRLGYNTTYSLGSQNTVFIVGQLTSPSAGNQFFDFIDGYTSSSRFFLFSSPNFLNNYVYGTNGSSSGQVSGAITTAQMTSPFCWSVAFDTSTTISSTLQYVNGTQLVQSPSTLGAAISSYTGIVIGQRFTQSSESVVGHICEFIIFNNVLTATQRQQVESYLAQKWGLVSSLPTTGHIHNTFPAGSPTAIQPYVASVSPLNLKFIAYPTGTPTVNTPTNTTTTLNMTWNAPTFTLTWNARQVSQVLITSYSVYILADGSLATTLTPGNVLSTTFSPMTAGVAYSFYVRANGPGGTSGASATSSTVTYILPPGSPTVNTPTNTVSTLNMTWNAPVGGGQVTSYTVYVLAAGSLVSTLTPGFVTSTTFSPMTGDVAYSFYVTATGPGGTSSVSSTSATVTYSAGPMSYLTGVNIYMSTSTTDWTNNWKPYLNAVFSCNSVSNITTTYNKIGISNWAATNHWQLGVAHPNSNIYFSPYNAANILCYNPFTSNQTFITGGPNSTASYTGTAKWNNGCLAPDGMIYFFPWTAATILGLNPNTNDTCNISLAGRGGTYTSSGYRNSILARDGRIYLSPYGATSIFWFNPSNFSTGNITSAAGVNLPGSSVRWEGTSFGADGNIYMNPLTGAQPVLRLNLSNYSTDTINAGLTAGQTFRGAATLSVNDSLYFAPAQANAGILYINSNLTTGIIANTTALVYRDSFYGPDGKIYIMPNNGSATVMVVNPANNTVTNSNNSLTSVNIQGAVMGLDGNIYGATYAGSNLLQVVFNNVAYKFDSNYILSPYVNHH